MSQREPGGHPPGSSIDAAGQPRMRRGWSLARRTTGPGLEHHVSAPAGVAGLGRSAAL